jgi:parallel beta-helix repeat protein
MTWVFRINKSILVGVAFVFMVIIFSPSNGVVFQGEQEVAVVRSTGQQTISADSYVPHGPITISSNADFSNQGWPGSGISSDPYVIEGLNITAYAICISITNTTVFFEVRTCIISSTSSSSLYEGIYFENVIHGTIRDCIISRHYRGISLYDSSNCTFMNNTATINYWSGFFLNHSDNCTLTNNTATSNSQFGFSLFSSYNCTLANNTAASNEYGFYLKDSNNCTLMDNTLVNNGIAIDGWSVSHWLNYYSGNTVNNKPLGYFKSLTSELIDGSQYGQVILANCSQVTVKDGVFTYASAGVQLGFCINCTLTNNTASSNSLYGFDLYFSNNSTLMNNTSTNNSYYGFYMLSSDNCTLVNNTATGNQMYGIYLGTGSEHNILYLNRLGNNSESNAQDDGGSNSWDDGMSSGNYWWDYNGTGTYLIPGSAGSVDHYPFVWKPVTTFPTEDMTLILLISFIGIASVVIIIFLRKRTK